MNTQTNFKRLAAFLLFFCSFYAHACVDLPRLLHDYRFTHGPEPRLEHILSLRLIGTILPNKQDASKRRFTFLKKHPDKSRISILGSNHQHSTIAFDGSLGWHQENELAPPYPLSQGYAHGLKRDASLHNHLFFQKKTCATYTFLRTEEINDERYFVVLATLPSAAQIEYFINQKTLHEDTVVFRPHPYSKSKEYRLECQNFVRIGEVVFPKKILSYDQDGKLLNTIEIAQCQWNCGLLDSLFQPI